MLKGKILLVTAIVIFNLAISLPTVADVTVADDSATFISVAPNALILLDLSGSMAWNPAGGSDIWGNSSCSGPFYSSSGTGHDVNCSRLAIAKRAIFNILDDDNSNTIDIQDSNSLGVQIGFMRYRDGDDTSGVYSSGNIQLIRPFATKYSTIYCGNSTSCASTVTGCTSGECVVGETANGGTPLASALREAKLYIDAYKNGDNAADCRQNFVIMITDGADTYTCSGDGAECQGHMYKRRRDTVAAAKALNDAGYKVFVVGFGSTMPDYLKNTLNWMAYYGGTDNPITENSGSESAYDPAAVSSCQTDSATESATCAGGATANFKATSNDPGYLSLSGYAFLAANADDLTSALRSAITTIREATYSFTQSSIQAVRTIDENYLYEASFSPLLSPNNDPFWLGHLKRYSIDEAGNIATTSDWDAGSILSSRLASSRVIYTYKAGSLTEFNSTNITMTDLGVTTDTSRLAVINFIRGGEQSGANAGWKLGDIYHSSPVTIGTPSAYFYDRIDTATTKAFDTFRLAHDRPSSSGKRLVLAGANDGQFHVFKVGESSAGGGSELWSFIPPNLLSKLTTITHSTHPTSLGHQYFVDGPIYASDVWLGTGSGASKMYTDWHTLVTVALGRGGTTKLWSSSSSCDSGINDTYSSTYPYYCGYYAFDVTETTSTPVFKWHLGGTTALTATEGSHLGQPWSKMIMGRVKIAGNEKWVGLIGGGYAGTDCKGGGSCDTKGKGFYVIDLNNGSILWKYTHSGPDAVVDANMDYSLAGPAATIDTDNDGFIDTAYIGDLGGNVWRFKFCLSSDSSSCGTSNWTGGMLFDSASATIRPIYTMPTVAKDDLGNLWVYFGTGDLMDPTAANAQEKMHAVKDNDRTTTYEISDLDNLTADGSTYNSSSSNDGWYINMTGSGQKILAEPMVFQGILYFTSYNPASANDPCAQGGEASLWAVDYKSGAGKFTGGARSTVIGSGIPSAPVVSLNPYGGTNIYASTSEGSGDGAHTKNIAPPSSDNFNRGNLLYWRDLRVQ